MVPGGSAKSDRVGDGGMRATTKALVPDFDGIRARWKKQLSDGQHKLYPTQAPPANIMHLFYSCFKEPILYEMAKAGPILIGSET